MASVSLFTGIDGYRPYSMSVYKNAVIEQLQRNHPNLCVMEETMRFRKLPLASGAINRYLRYFARALFCESDVVHILDQNNAPAAVLFPQKTRVVITVHDFNPAFYKGQSSRIFLRMQKLGIQRANAICTVSQSTKNDLLYAIDYPADRIHVSHIGVDKAVFKHVSIKPVVEDQPIELLHVGSEVPRKNLPFLMDVVAQLRQRHPSIRLTRVGTPTSPINDKITALGLKDIVRYRDNIENAELARLYQQSDLLMFPSTHEGFGLPVAEAMACGCPVLASNRTSIPEVGEDAVLYAPPDEIDTWVNLADELIRSRSKQLELRRKGLKRALNFSWKSHADTLASLYQGKG